ncbi:hypothetical protein B0H11DRAFT_2239564 [Mycena galericulata]|nr:hypothetical protein B0H11DRAFT_2239564 [Mycena galericulata]
MILYAGEKNAIYAGDIDEPDRVHLNPPKGKKRKARGPQNRKLIQRGHLQDQLLTWLASAYASDPLRAVRPASFILDAKAIKALHPDRLTSVSQVVSAVQETEEWGIESADQILAVVPSLTPSWNASRTSTPPALPQRRTDRLRLNKVKMTTATDVMDFHANILPVHIHLNRSAFNAAARLATLPPSNPIHRIFRRWRNVPRFHRSAIHHLIVAFPVFRHEFETINPQHAIPLAPPRVTIQQRVDQFSDQYLSSAAACRRDSNSSVQVP